MSYFPKEMHDALIADPAKIEDYYVQDWKKFAYDLGPVDYGLTLGPSILPVAYAAIAAWDLKPYGPEFGVSLDEILASPSLACDNYVRLTWYFTEFMPQVTWAPAKCVALGWNGGAAGNHAQMLVNDGTNTLMLDPTIGLVVRGVTFDTLLQGKSVETDSVASFESYNNYNGTSGAFTKTIKDAIMQGQYKPIDLMYYVKTLDKYIHMPASTSWLTPQGI